MTFHESLEEFIARQVTFIRHSQTFTAASQEVLIHSSKAGMDGIETLCDALELAHQAAVF